MATIDHSRAGPRPAEADAPSGGRLMVWEYLMRCWRRYAVLSLSEAIGTPLLYLLALGLGLGSLVDNGAQSAALGGVSYLQYIAPALLVAAAVQIGASEGSYPAYSRFKWSKVFWGVTATPVTPGQVCDGEVLFIGTRLLAASSLYYLVLLVFGVAGGPAGLLMIPSGVLTGIGCAVLILALGAALHSDGGAFAMVFRFVVVPLTLFSGSFFPITQLPLAVRWLAWISPLWHGNELARGFALGTAELWPTVGHAAYLAALFVAGLALARRLYRRRLIV